MGSLRRRDGLHKGMNSRGRGPGHPLNPLGQGPSGPLLPVAAPMCQPPPAPSAAWALPVLPLLAGWGPLRGVPVLPLPLDSLLMAWPRHRKTPSQPLPPWCAAWSLSPEPPHHLLVSRTVPSESPTPHSMEAPTLAVMGLRSAGQAVLSTVMQCHLNTLTCVLRELSPTGRGAGPQTATRPVWAPESPRAVAGSRGAWAGPG